AIATAWERFDALWFLRIADAGYRAADGSAAFFPGFPLAVRAVAWVLGGRPLAAGLLVANLAFLGALVALHALTSAERGGGTARATVVLLCWFPTSLFFLMPYSESLFLAAVAVAFLAWRRERWWLACAAALVAALTRNVGILLVPAFLAEAAAALRRGGPRAALRPLGVAASAAVGFGAYLLWWRGRGDLLAPFSAQANWQRELTAPWTTIADAVGVAVSRFGTANGGYWMFDLVVFVVVVVGAVWATRRLSPGLVVYLWGGLLLPLLVPFPGRPLMSVPRLVLPLFPAVWGLADLGHRLRLPPWGAPVVGAVGLGAVTLLVVNGYYIF
ncbi:MAG: mannosyltransferase family protein, partial [Actinomycetota bacterium]